MQRVAVISSRSFGPIGFLTPEACADRIPLKVGEKFPLLAAKQSVRAQFSC